MENPVWVSFTVKGEMTISFLLSLSLYFYSFVCLKKVIKIHYY